MSSSINFSSIGAPTAGYLGTDWVNAGVNTITGTTTNPTKGTTTVDNLWYRRVGGNVEIRIEYAQGAAGTAGSGDYLFALPAGLVIDTAKLTSYSTASGGSASTLYTNTVGTCYVALSGTGNGTGSVAVYDSTHVRLVSIVSAAAGVATDGTIGSTVLALSNANLVYDVKFSVPIVGWSSYGTMPINSPNAPLSISKNYLTSIVASTASGVANTGNGSFELGTTAGFTLAHSALTSLIPSSVGSAGVPFSASAGGSSASGNLSIGVVSSGQLAGSYSGSLASSAASTAGDMVISNAFYVDKEDQAKMMQISFNYSAVSGASNLNFSGTSSNSFAVYIYDVTNAAWIQPAGVYNLVQGTGAGKCTATFQTTSNSTQYQLALVNINASAGAYTLYLDDLNIGPQIIATGPAMTDWQSYTPTFGASFGTVTNISVQYRRVGDTMEIAGNFTTGTTTGALGGIGLPTGYTFDTTKLAGSSTNVIVGVGGRGTTGSNPGWDLIASPSNSTNSLYISYIAASSATPLTPQNVSSILGSSEAESFFARVPILGWSSNTSMSTDTDTRVVAASAYLSTNTAFSNPVIFNTVSFDTHGAYSTSTGKYTVPVAGIYEVSGYAGVTSGTPGIAIYKNGSLYNYAGYTNTNNGGAYSTLIQCVSGDTLYIGNNSSFTWIGSAPGVAGASLVCFKRLSGPAVIAATEFVKASYYASANFSCSTSQQANFDTKIYDSHGAVTTGSSWKFTAPVSGCYNVNFNLSGAPIAGNPTSFFYVYKNGSTAYFVAVNTLTGNTYPNYSYTLQLNASDYIDIRASNSTTYGGGTLGTFNASYIQIERLGN